MENEQPIEHEPTAERSEPRRGEPPNNRLKLPVVVIIGAVMLFLAASKAVDGHWLSAIVLGLLAVASIAEIRMITRGRNPWWMRSPLDRRH